MDKPSNNSTGRIYTKNTERQYYLSKRIFFIIITRSVVV